MANIAVIGTNYVGLVTAACFAELGNQVIGIDIDPGKVEQLSPLDRDDALVAEKIWAVAASL